MVVVVVATCVVGRTFAIHVGKFVVIILIERLLNCTHRQNFVQKYSRPTLSFVYSNSLFSCIDKTTLLFT